MKILIAYDGSIYGNIILDDLARAGLPADAEARIVSVVDTNAGPAGREPIEGLAEEIGVRVQQLFPQWEVKIETAWGLPATVILERARNWKTNLLIAGTHGSSPVRRLFLGSVSSALVQRAECSVRVVRSGFPDRDGPMRLVIGDDGSRQSQAVVAEVCRRRWRPNTEVSVISVVGPSTPEDEDTAFTPSSPGAPVFGRRHLQEVLEQASKQLAQAGLTPATAIREGDPADVLASEAEQRQADAIFIGARGLGFIESLLLGSVSSRVVRQAYCTVEVVR
jgi:nucleotide-binding universal stress UspA family protein